MNDKEKIKQAEKIVEAAGKKTDPKDVNKIVEFGDYVITVPPVIHSVAKKLMKISRENINASKDLQKVQMKLGKAMDGLLDVKADSKEEEALENRIDKLQNSVYDFSETLTDNKVVYITAALSDQKAEMVEEYPEILLDMLIEAINDRAGLKRNLVKND